MNLIIQPEAGLSPVVRASQQAKRTVGIAIFRTDREEIEKIGVLIINATVALQIRDIFESDWAEAQSAAA